MAERRNGGNGGTAERMAEWSNGGNGYIRTIYGRHTPMTTTPTTTTTTTLYLIFYRLVWAMLKSIASSAILNL